jgi:stage III sporulation protein SpoIIIAA
VPNPEQQHAVMIEAVENHMPEVCSLAHLCFPLLIASCSLCSVCLSHTNRRTALHRTALQTVVIDEIGSEAEALAARTIAERGVQLVATCHGNCRVLGCDPGTTVTLNAGGVARFVV